MKKFRLIIRVVFIVFIVLSILIGANDEKLIKEGFSFLWSKGVFTFYENMKTWGLIGLIIITIQFTLEYIQIISLKRKLSAKEGEVLQLKAQLYDKQSNETSAVGAQKEAEPATKQIDKEADKED